MKESILTPEDYCHEALHTKGEVCPVCQSSDIEGDGVAIECGIATQEVGCSACGAQWEARYRLVGYNSLVLPEVAEPERVYLDQVEKLMSQDLERAVTNRWGGTASALHISESGMSRLSAELSFIHTIGQLGRRDLADKLAKTLIRLMDMMAQPSERLVDGRQDARVFLSDDGTPHNFSFVKFRALEEKPENDSGRIVSIPDPKRYKKITWMRVELAGGLIYQGPGAGQSFSVSVDEDFVGWSMRT